MEYVAWTLVVLGLMSLIGWIIWLTSDPWWALLLFFMPNFKGKKKKVPIIISN